MLHLYPNIEVPYLSTLQNPEKSNTWVFGFKSDGAYIKMQL